MVVNNLNWSIPVEYNAGSARLVPTSSGIYMILVRQEVGGYLARYIGKAHDLHARFLEHLSPYEQNACIKGVLANYGCQFQYALIAREGDRVDTEAAWIRQNSRILQCNNNGVL